MRRIREPATMAIVLLCVLWTLGSKALGLTYSAAGALTSLDLWRGEYWRLLAAMLLHHRESWIHLGVNALSLYFVGRVIERACGRRILVAALVGAGLAGSAASLVLVPDPRVQLMGISGGIAGLVGLILALEWRSAKGILDFLRQRNTILILVFIGLSLPFALGVEALLPDVRVDHSAHIAGFAFGVALGLAYYTRRGPRPLRGAIVAAALSILPSAYAAHPLFDPLYYAWRGDRFSRAGDAEGAEAAYARVLELDPGNAYAAIRLAGIRNDPAYLERVPRTIEWHDALGAAYLDLACRRAAEDPEGARALAAKALELRTTEHRLWARYAAAMEEAGLPDDAYRAWREAAGALPPSQAWRPLAQALRLLALRPEWKEEPPPSSLVLDSIRLARGTAMGLAEGTDAETRAQLEQVLTISAEAATGAVVAHAERGIEREELAELAADLASLFQALAENTTEPSRRPSYRVRSAYWLWREWECGAKDPEGFEAVRARFGAAREEAAEEGDPRARALAEEWFRERGLPVPDLEGEAGPK